ncbi:MAG: hypothetical protein K0U54_13445 [Bacteroidetes bacterium]|nr:hypothetical protein [Bacteroidota bacterium]
MTSLDARNGNNHNMTGLESHDNFDLFCIEVDDVVFANNQSCGSTQWCKDGWVSYSEACP